MGERFNVVLIKQLPFLGLLLAETWIPAFAGMTGEAGMTEAPRDC